MSKIFKIVAVLVVTFILGVAFYSFAFQAKGAMTTAKDPEICPHVKAYGSFADIDGKTYQYLIDENTSVVYLYVHSGAKCGITVVLNTDGSPMTEEQLKALTETTAES